MNEQMLRYITKRFLKDEKNPYMAKYDGYDELAIFMLLGYAYGNLKLYIENHPDVYKDAQEYSRIMSYIW